MNQYDKWFVWLVRYRANRAISSSSCGMWPSRPCPISRSATFLRCIICIRSDPSGMCGRFYRSFPSSRSSSGRHWCSSSVGSTASASRGLFTWSLHLVCLVWFVSWLYHLLTGLKSSISFLVKCHRILATRKRPCTTFCASARLLQRWSSLPARPTAVPCSPTVNYFLILSLIYCLFNRWPLRWQGCSLFGRWLSPSSSCVSCSSTTLRSNTGWILKIRLTWSTIWSFSC